MLLYRSPRDLQQLQTFPTTCCLEGLMLQSQCGEAGAAFKSHHRLRKQKVCDSLGEFPCFLGERYPDPSQLPQFNARHHPLSWHIYYPYMFTSHKCSQVKNTVSLEHPLQLSLRKNRRTSQQQFNSLQD